jgi:predicted permease
MDPQNNIKFSEEVITSKKFNKQYLSITISFVVGITLGLLTYPYLQLSSNNSKNNYQVGFNTGQQMGHQAGFNEAKSLVEQSTFGNLFRGPDDVRTLSGNVIAINNSNITLRTVSNNPFTNPSLINRTIIISTSTKIIEFKQKDPTIYQSEVDAFQKTTQLSSSVPPNPFIQTATNLASIKVGSALIVIAGENIKSIKEFVASEIHIQSQALPAGTPSQPLNQIKK